MDRLVMADVKEVNLVFTRAQKSSATFNLTNLMHTMSVAVSLTTTNPSLFSFPHPFAVIPPLASATFTLLLPKPAHHPPIATPPDNLLVRSSMLPTGKATQEDLRRLFSRPGRNIFKDAVVPISFVGPQVIDFLLSSPSSISIDVAFVMSKAVSWCDESQLTSLLIPAAKTGDSRVVSSLIAAGADVNGGGDGGESVMSLAITSGNIDMVRILIESGYRFVDRCLHDSASVNRVDIMEALCTNYLDLDVNSVDSRGQTPLHIAANRGYLETLRFLITLGADPDVADHDGWTPLHHASRSGHLPAVELLLNSSCYVNHTVTKDGKTAFALAVENGHTGLYDMLHLGDVLHRSARTGDVSRMKVCLAEGADANGKDQNGWTPLHRAAFKGRIECVRLLLDHGAELDLVDNTGYAPLHRAVEAGHAQVAMVLIAHGARASMKSLVDHVVSFDLDSIKSTRSSLVAPLCDYMA